MKEDALNVTEQDSRSAMSLGFQWFEKSIGTLIKSVRSRNTRQTKEDKKEAAMAIQSAPNLRISRRRSAGAIERVRTEKKPRPNNRRSTSARNPPQHNAVAGPSSQRVKPTARRGSITHLLPSPHLPLPTKSPSTTPTPSRSPTPNSHDHPRVNGYNDNANHKIEVTRQKIPVQTTGNQQLRPKTRFSLSSLKNLRPKGWSSTSSTNSPSPVEPSTPATIPFISGYISTSPARSVPDVFSQSSDEGFPILRGRESCRNLRGSGRLTTGLRASSWGDFTDWPRRSDDANSIYSGERTDDVDDLDEGARRFGAGGVGHGPGPPTNGGLMGTHSSMGTERTSSGGDLPMWSASIGAAMASAIPIAFREMEDPPNHPDPNGPYGRQTLHPRIHTASPLNQSSINHSYDSDESSLFNLGYCGPQNIPPSGMYDNDGDDDDDDEDSDTSNPIEVRRRRPSVPASHSPPSSETEDDGRAT